MESGSYRFDGFYLDAANRLLMRDNVPVELNARYFDALMLLVRQQGRLISKEQFLDEVWRGVPVTDEALTQCIRTLRRQLGDDASRPRLIETVPKHGYRFIARVEPTSVRTQTEQRTSGPPPLPSVLILGSYGTLGGAAAGIIGGVFYGFAAAPPSSGAGVSVLLVLVTLTVGVAILGGAGVAFGIGAAYARTGAPGPAAIVGGSIGGLLVGAVVKLIGSDALSLLFGHSPPDMTGAPEGMVLGASVGAAAWLATLGSRGRAVALAAGVGALAGALIPLLGGQMLGGSLALLVDGRQSSRLDLASIGSIFGEQGFGPFSAIVTGGIEGLLFCTGVVAGLEFARRRNV